MTLNIKADMAEAIQELRGSPQFGVVMAGLHEVASDRAHAALSVPVDQRVDATAYARALVDLWVIMTAVSTKARSSTVARPKVPTDRAAKPDGAI